MHLTVRAVDSSAEKHLQTALDEVASRDPSVSITQSENGAFVLKGTTESHLESICDHIRHECHLAIDVSPLRAVLIEAIRKQAEAEGKYIRQTGGLGNYGHCKIRIEPNEPGKGYEFINDIKGGVIPKEYIKPIDQGIQSAMERGILAGFPVVDVKVTLFEGSSHEVDSNEMAFMFAGSIAFKEAARKASPVLLEPMMAVEIEVPEELTAAIRGEILAHRGRIESKLAGNGLSEIKAIVPLSELLTSVSSGLAEFPMEFAGYEPLSDQGSSGEDVSGVTSNKPNSPRPGRRSEMIQPDPAED
jgi:elongation factor G